MEPTPDAPSRYADIATQDELCFPLEKLAGHSAFEELEKFGNRLVRKHLTLNELKVFFATLWAFFEQFPTGILALALRVSDEWSKVDAWGATAKGAHILFADVDEFGLRDIGRTIDKSHHQMFKEFTSHVGVDPLEMLNPAYVLPEGQALGRLVAQLYRQESVAIGLGIHLASELIAGIEFEHFLKGFQAHKEVYHLKSDDDPALTFLKIHTIVEPEHMQQNCGLIKAFLSKGLFSIDDVEDGAVRYLNGFGRVYARFNAGLVVN